MKRFGADLTEDQLKKKILDAANARFRLFGFKKTAMAEIAGDVGMSTANLYRYFSSKIDIAEAFALQIFEEKEKILVDVVKSDSSIATMELRKMATELLSFNYQQLKNHPMINDIIVALCEAKPELVVRKRQGELDILLKILRKGCDEGCWEIKELEKKGIAILASWVMFSTPMFMQHQTLEELSGVLSDVLDITLNGLEKRE